MRNLQEIHHNGNEIICPLKVDIHRKFNMFEFTIHISTDYMLTIGGALIAIYAGWVLPKHLEMESFTDGNSCIAKIWVFLLKFISSVVPIIILIYPNN